MFYFIEKTFLKQKSFYYLPKDIDYDTGSAKFKKIKLDTPKTTYLIYQVLSTSRMAVQHNFKIFSLNLNALQYQNHRYIVF